ncbi:hypothetical protein SDC9_76134 [bioreactor metagenome]|uniref:Uncharacterized protein n=1 Tax=bioreactor metagenome TaxID=1076179 RepID=A0A644YU88_9ZZZZ
MDVVVDEVVAVLEVLALADDVGADQYVQLAGFARHGHVTLLGARGEQGHDLLEVVALPQRGVGAVAAGDNRRLQSSCSEGGREVLVEVISGVREGGEHQNLAVAGVDRMLLFGVDDVLELAELQIVVGGDLVHLVEEFAKGLAVIPQVPLPGLDVEVVQVDADLVPESEGLDVGVVLVVDVEVLACHVRHKVGEVSSVVADPGQGVCDGALDLAQRQPEGFHGAFQAFEKVDGHQLLETLLAARLPQIRVGATCGDVVKVLVLAATRWEHVGQRGVDRQGQRL